MPCARVNSTQNNAVPSKVPNAKSVRHVGRSIRLHARSSTIAPLRSATIQVCDQSDRDSVLQTGDPNANPTAMSRLTSGEHVKRHIA